MENVKTDTNAQQKDEGLDKPKKESSPPDKDTTTENLKDQDGAGKDSDSSSISQETIEDQILRKNDELNEAKESYNLAKKLVNVLTDQLDELLIKQANLAGAIKSNPLQDYLRSDNEQREKIALRRKEMFDKGLDPRDIVAAFDLSSPIDRMR